MLASASLASAALACHSAPAAAPVAPTAPASVAPAAAVIAPDGPKSLALLPSLEASFVSWEQAGPTGDSAHKERLAQLAEAIAKRLAEAKPADVVFVCTHNSRRSHMAQLLAQAAAQRAGLASVRTFSGGTEATAFNDRAVAALERVGFAIARGEGKNPHHLVRFSSEVEPAEAYSKRFTDAPNPSAGFVVVMTCSQADVACPVVHGAVARVAVPYEDPKVADGTPEEAARYDERVAQIGRDLAWVMKTVASR